MFDFFKGKPKYIDVTEDKGVRGMPLKTKAVIILIVAAVIFVAVSGFNSDEKKKEHIPAATDEVSSEYITETERRLSAALSNIKGAGKVYAMVNFCEYGEKELAADEKTEIQSENNGESTQKSDTKEKSAVIYGSGSGQQPFIKKQKLPIPEGVLVIAEGANQESVKLEIYEAVRALYGISGHRIKVAQGSTD